MAEPAKHGTTRRFHRGCRCDPCRLAWNAYLREHRRRRKAERPPKPPKPPAPPYRRPDGYVVVQVGPKLRKMQHRIVMEAILGRPLLRTEHVHHRNGVKHDNRPENLELWSTSHPKGQSVLDLVEWAREILARYEHVADKIAA